MRTWARNAFGPSRILMSKVPRNWVYGFGFPECVYECMNVSMRVYVDPNARKLILADAFLAEEWFCDHLLMWRCKPFTWLYHSSFQDFPQEQVRV